MNEMLSLANSQFRGGRNTKYSGYYAEKKKWKNKIAQILKENNVPRFDGKVWLSAVYYVPTRANDADNVRSTLKFILDGLTPPKKDEPDRYWIIRSDNLTVIQSPYVDDIKIDKNRRVELMISDLPLYEVIPTFKDIDVLTY